MENQGQLAFGGKLGVRLIRAPRAPLGWRISNALRWAYLRGWLAVHLAVPAARLFGLATAYGTLSLVHISKDGVKTNYGIVGHRVVTTAFVTALATYMFDGSTAVPTAYDYHDSGVGTTAESAADTDIQTTDGESRVAGTPSNPSAGVYRSVGTISYTTTKAITEHGLFSASTAGTLLDRTVFTAVNVVSGDSIQFTYSLTLTAGS